MYRHYMPKRPCSCNQNYYNEDQNIIDKTCGCIKNDINMNSNCECGFDEEDNLFPSNPMFAQSYVPWQTMNKTFIPSVGLKMGTIFPELVSPYMPGQSMEEIEYIKNENKIGEGCNK